MAKEVLYVPEENLEEVIRVLRAGLEVLKKDKTITRDTRGALVKWCKDEEKYLRRMKKR